MTIDKSPTCIVSYAVSCFIQLRGWRGGTILDQLSSFCWCLFVIICMLLDVNIQTGGCGVAEGVIAKSLLQKTV